MKKVRVPDCVKPDNPEEAKQCAAPLIVLGAILALAALLMLGCATIKGAGQDLQDASDATREYLAQPDPYTAR